MKKIDVRRIDSLGRIVIPMEIRKELGIDINTELEIHTEGDEFIISKYTDFCWFCKRTVPTQKFKNKNICKECLNEMKRIRVIHSFRGTIKKNKKIKQKQLQKNEIKQPQNKKNQTKSNKVPKEEKKLEVREENNRYKKFLKTIFKFGN